MLVVCHDRRALSARVMRRRSPIFDVEHLQLFSPRSIRRLLEVSGFERIEVSRLVNRYPLGYWLRLAPVPERARNALHSAFSTVRLTDMPLKVSAGNLVAVGYKPTF